MSHNTDDDRVIRHGDDRLLVHSEDDLERILTDAFTDIREFVDDDADAAAVIEVVHERMTDDFYYE